MAATAQLQPLLERAVTAVQAKMDAREPARRAQLLRQRLDLLRLPPKLEWKVRDDDWDAIQRREHYCIWPGLYRMRIWRLGPVGGAWGWELQTLSGVVLRADIVRRKRDAKGAAELATAAAIKVERDQLERETAA